MFFSRTPLLMWFEVLCARCWWVCTAWCNKMCECLYGHYPIMHLAIQYSWLPRQWNLRGRNSLLPGFDKWTSRRPLLDKWRNQSQHFLLRYCLRLRRFWYLYMSAFLFFLSALFSPTLLPSGSGIACNHMWFGCSMVGMAIGRTMEGQIYQDEWIYWESIYCLSMVAKWYVSP